MHADITNTNRGYCLCLGAAKAGTTWLYEQLRHSSQMYFAPEKELHYFFSRYGSFNRLSSTARFSKLNEFVQRANSNFINPMVEPEFARKFTFFQRNLDWYQSFAQGPVTQSWYRNLFLSAGPNQYACDFSPSTSKINSIGVKAIHDLGENVKLIYILRDPTDRLWSHTKFHAQFMGRFDEVKEYSPQKLVKFVRDHDLQIDGHYGSVLKRYLDVFERSDVLVLDFSEIYNDPIGLLRQVCSFLEIDQLDVSEKVRSAVNVSQKMKMPDGLLDGFHKEMETEITTLEALGYEFPLSWRDSLNC